MFSRLGCISGHYINFVPNKGTSIILGWSPSWLKENNDSLKEKEIIILNAEQLSANSVVVSESYLNSLKEWPVAEYHQANSPYLNNFFLLPIIPSSAVFYDCAIHEKDIDILFYGSINNRRNKIISNLIATGVRVHIVNKIYGYHLAQLINRSHIVLHIHYYETKFFPIIRFLQPIMRKIPIVCESSHMSDHNDWTESGILFADYDQLTITCLRLLANQEMQNKAAESVFRFSSLMKIDKSFCNMFTEELAVAQDSAQH